MTHTKIVKFIVLCGSIGFLSCNAYSSSSLAVTDQAANLSASSPIARDTLTFRVTSDNTALQGSLITLALSGPVNKQVNCLINNKVSCHLQLPVGNYCLSALNLTQNGQSFVGNISALSQKNTVSVRYLPRADHVSQESKCFKIVLDNR